MFVLLLCILITPFVHPSIIFPVKFLALCLFAKALSIPAASLLQGDIIKLIIIIIPSMTIVPTTRWYGDACVYAPLRHYCSFKEVGSDPTHALGPIVACPTAVSGNVLLLTLRRLMSYIYIWSTHS